MYTTAQKGEKSLIFLLVKDMKAPQDSYSSKGKLCKFIMHFRYRWLYWSWSLYFAHAWSQSSHVTHKVWKINLQKVCVITLQGQSLKHKALLHPSCLELSLLHIGIFFAQLLWLKKKKKSSQLCFWWINDDIVGFRGYYTFLSYVESQLLNQQAITQLSVLCASSRHLAESLFIGQLIHKTNLDRGFPLKYIKKRADRMFWKKE